VSVDRREVVAVVAGGIAGTLARAGLGVAVPTTPGCWPWATFVANLVGAAALALVLARRDRLGAYGGRLLGTGFCGALTSFSAIQIELLDLLDAGRDGLAALYVVASIGLGLALVRIVGRLA
jgi:CrcB protein